VNELNEYMLLAGKSILVRRLSFLLDCCRCILSINAWVLGGSGNVSEPNDWL